MGITMLTLGGLFAPLQAFMAWLSPPHQRNSGRHPSLRHTTPASATRQCAAATPVRRAPPLRVVRVIDASSATAGAGRMFMSGRMADVCAELDRLAALEAAAG